MQARSGYARVPAANISSALSNSRSRCRGVPARYWANQGASASMLTGISASLDRDRIHRCAGAVDHLQRGRGVEEGVLLVGRAVVGQIVEPGDLGECDAEVAHQRVV